MISLLSLLFLSSCSGWRWPGETTEPRQLVEPYQRRVYHDEYDNSVYGGENALGHLSHLQAQLYMQPDNKTGDKVAQWHEGMGVNPEELGEYAEGDILYPATMGRNGIKTETARWPDGVVPYLISPFFSEYYFLREMEKSA